MILTLSPIAVLFSRREREELSCTDFFFVEWVRYLVFVDDLDGLVS